MSSEIIVVHVASDNEFFAFYKLQANPQLATGILAPNDRATGRFF